MVSLSNMKLKFNLHRLSHQCSPTYKTATSRDLMSAFYNENILVHKVLLVCKPFQVWFFVQLCSSRQDFNWHSVVSRGPSTTS